MRKAQVVAILLLTMSLLFPTLGLSTGALSGDSSGSSVSPGMTTLLTEFCENCMFPITIAGQAVSGSASQVPQEAYREPICWCKKVFGIPIPGLPYGAWIPARMTETVLQPFDSPIYGTNLSGTLGSLIGGTVGYLRGSSGVEQEAGSHGGFFNFHVFPYPAGDLYSSLMSIGCLSDTDAGAGKVYMSEIDPSWDTDSLSLFDTPEAAVFSSLPAQLACLPDSAAADVDQPLDALFWCMGSWGSSYPQDGGTEAMDVPRQAALTAAHGIAMLQRRLLINKTMGEDAICNAYPEPVLTKSMFKLEQLWPVPELSGDHWFGADPNLWGEFRYRAFTGENFVQLNWQWTDCCVG